VAELTPGLAGLAVEPDVLHAPAVELAVDHNGQPFDLRLHAGCQAGVVDDRPRAVLLQFLVDLPDQTPALLPIGHRRLLNEQRLQIGVAISGVVALRTAAVVLEELLVGIVDAAAVLLRPIW